MLSRNMKDRRIGFVTVTGVTLTPDLKHARVFISTMGSKEEKTVSLKTLKHATGWIRRELGQRIRTRFVPELTFLIDNSQEYGERIDRLLDEIHGKDNE